MSFRNTALACATSVTLLAASATADAQMVERVQSTAGDDAPIENGALSAVASVLGGFRVDATMNTLYDSNIFRLGQGFPPRAGRSKPDVRVSPVVTLSYGTAIGRQQLFLSGLVGRDIYVENTDRNRNHYGLNGGLNWRLGGRCSGTIDGDYSSRQQLLSEVSSSSQNVQQLLSYGGSATCRSATGISVGGDIHRNTTRNNDLNRKPFDSSSTSFSPQLSYGSPTLGEFSLSGSLNHVKYPNRPVLDSNHDVQAEGIDIRSGRFGYQRGLGGRLSANFGVSYYDVTPRPRDVLLPIIPGLPFLAPVSRKSNSNLGYDLGLNYNSGSRLTAALTARKSAQASVNVGAQYQVIQAISGTIDYQLNRSVTANTGVTYTQRDYKNSFASVPEPLRRLQDKITRAYVGLSYSPGSRYTVSGEVAYQDRSSRPVEYSFHSVAALLRLRVGFGGHG